MKLVVQRVLNAQVDVDGKTVGKINKGFMVLCGITHEDTHRLSDMWSALRHAQYNLQQHKDDWDVRAHKPFQMSDWNMIEVEVE